MSFAWSSQSLKTSGPLAYNAPATGLGSVQAALEGLLGIGKGNVEVVRNDDVYVIRFRGDLTTTNVQQLTTNSSGLTKTVELLGGATSTATGAATVMTRVQGHGPNAMNDVLALTVRATGGTFALSYDLDTDGVIETGETTNPIAFDASDEDVRKAIQKLLAQGDEFQELKFDVTVERFVHYYNAPDETTVRAEVVYVVFTGASADGEPIL